MSEESEFSKKLDSLVIQAMKDAVAINRKLGTPIYVMRDGQIVDISKEEPKQSS